jgi:hypothetical protein
MLYDPDVTGRLDYRLIPQCGEMKSSTEFSKNQRRKGGSYSARAVFDTMLRWGSRSRVHLFEMVASDDC